MKANNNYSFILYNYSTKEKIYAIYIDFVDEKIKIDPDKNQSEHGPHIKHYLIEIPNRYIDNNTRDIQIIHNTSELERALTSLRKAKKILIEIPSSLEYQKRVEYYENVIGKYQVWFEKNVPDFIPDDYNIATNTNDPELRVAVKLLKQLRNEKKALKLYRSKPTPKIMKEIIDKHRFKSSEIANCTKIGADLGIDPETAKSWIEKLGLSDYAFNPKHLK